MSVEDFRQLLHRSSVGVVRTQGNAATDAYREELEALLAEPRHTPKQMRRIAELWEFFDTSVARQWWTMAAEAGDRDAADMLAELEAEDNTP